MKYLFLIPALALIGCTSQAPIQETKQPQPYQPKPVKEAYDLTTADGINLKVEIDYKLSEFGYLNNDCQCNYIITNLSNKTLKKEKEVNATFINGAKYVARHNAKILFEIKTNDNKSIEASDYINEDLAGSFSTQAKSINGKVGKDRFCTSIKPIKVVYER